MFNKINNVIYIDTMPHGVPSLYRFIFINNYPQYHLLFPSIPMDTPFALSKEDIDSSVIPDPTQSPPLPARLTVESPPLPDAVHSIRVGYTAAGTPLSINSNATFAHKATNMSATNADVPAEMLEPWNTGIRNMSFMDMSPVDQAYTVTFFEQRYETLSDPLLRTRVLVRDLHFYGHAHPLRDGLSY